MLNQTTWVYSIIIIAAWILLPLYVKLVKQAFIGGIFISVLVMSYLPVTPILLGTAPWFTFSRGLVDLTYIIYYVIALLSVYFCFKSWRELQPK